MECTCAKPGLNITTTILLLLELNSIPPSVYVPALRRADPQRASWSSLDQTGLTSYQRIASLLNSSTNTNRACGG